MKRIRILLQIALASWATTSTGAVLKIEPVGPSAMGFSMITVATAAPGEIVVRAEPFGNVRQINIGIGFMQGGAIRCSMGHNSPGSGPFLQSCAEGGRSAQFPPFNTPIRCDTAADAAASLGRWVGFMYPGVPPTAGSLWNYSCYQDGTRYTLPSQPVDLAPTPAACTANVAPLTLRGQVGQRLKETTDLQIHCDRPADLRVSIPNGGVVTVGGEGEVLLTFKTNGSDVLNISGTDPQVSVDGELTKSPTTAGTYRGSTVLRLDIL